MEVSWLACELKSGLIVGEVPLATQTFRRIVGREERVTFALPVHDPQTPPNWINLLAPGMNMLVLCIDDAPVQAWAIIHDAIGSAGVKLTGVTLEHCLARQNVPTVDLDNVAETDIYAALTAHVADGFGFTVGVTPSTTLGWCDYTTEEDLTVLAALNERSELVGAPEWRIHLSRSWNRIVKHIEIAPRVGQDRPDVIFELDDQGRGNIASYERSRDYGPGAGATVVQAVSDGSGGSRPMSAVWSSSLIDTGWPTWENRPRLTNPDDRDDEDGDLERLARQKAIDLMYGTTTWTVTGDDNAPQPGRDYHEGDTVRVAISPRGVEDPFGSTTTVRILGWELDPTTGRTTLIAWEESDE